MKKLELRDVEKECTTNYKQMFWHCFSNWLFLNVAMYTWITHEI